MGAFKYIKKIANYYGKGKAKYIYKKTTAAERSKILTKLSKKHHKRASQLAEKGRKALEKKRRGGQQIGSSWAKLIAAARRARARAKRESKRALKAKKTQITLGRKRK